MLVKFLRAANYPQVDPSQSRHYEAGETYDLEENHAMRWVTRGVAVKVETPEAPPAPPAVEPLAEETSEPVATKQARLPRR